MNGARRTSRRTRDSGAVLVEFSLVFVLFAFICYALVAFGLAMNLKSNLTHAAAEGARSAVGAGAAECVPTDGSACETAKVAAARSRVADAVGGQSSQVRDEVAAVMTAGIGNCDDVNLDAAPYCIFVSIPYRYDQKPIVPSAPGLGVFLPNTLRAEAVVQLTN